MVPVFKDIIVSVETPQVSSCFPLVLVVMRDTCSCLQNNLKNLLIPVKQGGQETLLFAADGCTNVRNAKNVNIYYESLVFRMI